MDGIGCVPNQMLLFVVRDLVKEKDKELAKLMSRSKRMSRVELSSQLMEKRFEEQKSEMALRLAKVRSLIFVSVSRNRPACRKWVDGMRAHTTKDCVAQLRGAAAAPSQRMVKENSMYTFKGIHMHALKGGSVC